MLKSGTPRWRAQWTTTVWCAWVRKTYYSDRNKFERFRCFLELISRFEFEFCRCENYICLKDPNFWCVHVNVVAVHVLVPWPVRAHAIPFRMLWLP